MSLGVGQHASNAIMKRRPAGLAGRLAEENSADDARTRLLRHAISGSGPESEACLSPKLRHEERSTSLLADAKSTGIRGDAPLCHA